MLAKAKLNNVKNDKKAQNDEVYTRLGDIEKELNEYDPEVFRNKVIFCNCDDPSSNFWIFFHMNFNRFGLKKLIATHYTSDGSPSYALEYTSEDPKDDVDFDKSTKIPLKGDGDFRSDECIELLKQSDMVVTNPSFSLFRAYIAQLEQYNKEFIVIGDKKAITYKEIFPLIKDDKLWLGFSQPKEFKQPDGTYKKFSNKLWFTNVDTEKRHHKLENVYRWRQRIEKYPDLYHKYDNCDAIEVSDVLQIPLDYDGVMGVPITFVDIYDPDQFEIIGLARDTVPKANLIGGCLTVNGKRKYARILIKNKHPEDYQND